MAILATFTKQKKKQEYIENWEIDGCEDVHEDLFDIEILEV